MMRPRRDWASCLAFFALFSADLSADPSMPTVPPPASIRWNIAHHGTRIDQEFVLTQKHSVNFDIEFHHNGLPAGWSKFIGDGDVTFYTKDPLHPTPVQADNPSDLYTRWSRGELDMRLAHPGVVVPVHIRLLKVDEATRTEKLIMDKTYNTEGLYRGGHGVIGREIIRVPLEPGRYRIIAETVKDVALPPARSSAEYTALGITYRVY